MTLAVRTLRKDKAFILRCNTTVRLAGLVIGLLLVFTQALAFNQPPLNPSEVRTAYLYHFMRFIDWPEQVRPTSDQAYTICVPAESPEIQFLAPITQKKVNGQPVAIKPVDDQDSLSMCHILYLIDVKPNERDTYIKTIKDLPVLSVGNDDRFLNHGGMIAFNVNKGQVTFSVNLRAAHRVKLKISANMLDVAEEVIK